MDSTQIQSTIIRLIEHDLPTLPPDLQSWVKSHLIEPRCVTLANDQDGITHSEFWLITDQTGVDDSNCRVVFDPASSAFGLEWTEDTGVEWYMGLHGSFAETVMSM